MSTIIKNIGTVRNPTGEVRIIDIAVTLVTSSVGAFVGKRIGGAAGTAIGALVGTFVSAMALNQLKGLRIIWREDGAVEAEMTF